MAVLDANNVSTDFFLPEALFWDLNNSGYRVPKIDAGQGVTKTSIFAGSIWMGGLDETDNLKVAAGTYRQSGTDFFPGPLNDEGETLENGCTDFNYAWPITQSEVQNFVQSGYNEEFITDNIRNWPGRNNPLFNMFDLPQNLDLAPFVDTNNDNTYNPLDGDYPIAKGTQNFWWVFNDIADDHALTNSEPLGMQIGGYCYSVASENEALDNTTFWEFELINKSQLNLSNFHMGFWVDFELGNYLDDYLGGLPNQNIAYCYNQDDYDDGTAGYGYEIPIVGVEVLEGLKDDNNNDIGLSSFIIYNNNLPIMSTPETKNHFYNYLKGLQKDGTPIVNPVTNTETTFMYPGSLVENEEWSLCTDESALISGTSKTVLSSGPSFMASGQKTTVKYAIYWIPDVPHPCPDVSPYLQNYSSYAHELIEQNIALSSMEIEAQNIIVSPNPTSKQVSINSPQQAFNQIDIYTLNGQWVQSHKGFTNQLNIENLANGQYLISFAKNKKRIATQKLVVLR